MLVLSRHWNEEVVIGDGVVYPHVSVIVVQIRGDKVRLGFIAPRDVPVHRKEVSMAIEREEALAHTAVDSDGVQQVSEPDGSVHLFIGGRFDGQWRALPGGQSVVEIPYRDVSPRGAIAVGTEIYRLQRFSSGTGTYTVFVPIGMPVDAVFQALIANYRPGPSRSELPGF